MRMRTPSLNVLVFFSVQEAQCKDLHYNSRHCCIITCHQTGDELSTIILASKISSEVLVSPYLTSLKR